MNLFRKTSKIAILIALNITSVFAGVIPLYNPSDTTLYKNTFSLKANLLLTNDAFSLRNLLLTDMNGDLHSKSGDNIALGIERVNVGYGHKKYGYFGYIYREDVFINSTKDAVELIYLATNEKDLPTGKYYNLHFKINAYKMKGIIYSNMLTLYKKKDLIIHIGFGIEGLYAKEMQDGYIDGYAIAQSKKDYSFSGNSKYNYTHNYLYDLFINPSYAYGYSTHLSLLLKKGKYQFRFIANDLISKLYWKQLPYSNIHLSSNNKTYNENGYVKYTPLLSGKEEYRDYIQTLMPKYRLEGTCLYKKKINIKIGSDYMQNIYMPFIGFLYNYNQNMDIGLEFESRFKSLKLNTRYKHYTLSLETDDIFKPSTLSISLGISY